MTLQAIASILGLAALSAGLLSAAAIIFREAIRHRDGLLASASIVLAVLAVYEAMAALHVWRFVP